MKANGSQGHYLDEIPKRHDDMFLPPRQVREEQARLEAETQRYVQIMADDYGAAEGHLISEVEFAGRIVPEGLAALDEEVLTPLRRGELSAKDAAKRVAEMRRDLNKARDALRLAAEREESKWSEVGGVSAAEYQRALARRAPQLFAGGRGLINLPIYSDD